MSWDQHIAAFFRLDDEGWMRHANPWSAYTRIAIAPLLVAAIWSRMWLGWWCLAPIGLLIVWTIVNPRAFPPPKSTDNWASKGVLGERIWVARDQHPVPRHHRVAALLLTLLSTLGLPPLIYGLWTLDAWATLCGFALTFFGKLWFVDRMVWLHEDQRAGYGIAGDASR